MEGSNLLFNEDTWFFLLLKEAYNLLLVTQDKYGGVVLVGESVEFFHLITDDGMHFV